MTRPFEGIRIIDATHVLAGPFAASLTTSNVNEVPAVWCLLSIALCLAIIKTPLRHHLYVGAPWWEILAQWRSRTALAHVGANATRVAGLPQAGQDVVHKPG